MILFTNKTFMISSFFFSTLAKVMNIKKRLYDFLVNPFFFLDDFISNIICTTPELFTKNLWSKNIHFFLKKYLLECLLCLGFSFSQISTCKFLVHLRTDYLLNNIITINIIMYFVSCLILYWFINYIRIKIGFSTFIIIYFILYIVMYRGNKPISTIPK
jgi:hypothetical protein